MADFWDYLAGAGQRLGAGWDAMTREPGVRYLQPDPNAVPKPGQTLPQVMDPRSAMDQATYQAGAGMVPTFLKPIPDQEWTDYNRQLSALPAGYQGRLPDNPADSPLRTPLGAAAESAMLWPGGEGLVMKGFGAGAKLAAGVLPKLGRAVGIGAAEDVAKAGAARAAAAGVRDDAFFNAARPDAPFPQYAEQYPPVGPPVLMSKPGKPKPIEGVPGAWNDPNSPAAQMVADKQAFWEKEQTPEAQAFQKKRLAIMKDMRDKGYTPYFDPALREHVDPADYPTNLDMTRDALPAKQQTIDNFKGWMDTPEGRDRLMAGYQAGLTVKDSDRWYAMKQLQDKYISELGPEAGRDAFRQKFANSMAATTGGADPRSNYLMSLYHNWLIEGGVDTPVAHQMPYPIGGRFAASNMKQADKVMRDPGFTGFDENNPKRHDFSFAFMGHPNKFTMDEQMSGGLVPIMPKTDTPMTIPPGDSYGIAAGIGHDLARQLGIAPRDFQDVAWAGLKKQKVEGEGGTFNYEGPMINQVNDAVERTHRLTGMPREEIMKRGIIRNQIPIYGLGGAALGLPWMFPQQGRDGS